MDETFFFLLIFGAVREQLGSWHEGGCTSGELQGLILPAVLPQAVLGWFLLREAPLLVLFPGQRGISTFHKATLSLGNEAVLSSMVGVPCCCGAQGSVYWGG